MMNGLSLLVHISLISDSRQSWKVEHKLSDIIFFAIAAVIGSAEGREEIQYFGDDDLDWFRQYVDFDIGIPVHDTIARVMGMISAKLVQKCFAEWMKSCHDSTEGEVIAIDGKAR